MLSAPHHLRDAGRSFFETVAGEYGIADAAGTALLSRAAEFLDRMAAAHIAIAAHGELVPDSYGAVKLNLPVIKDARNGFLAAVRAPNLDLEALTVESHYLACEERTWIKILERR